MQKPLIVPTQYPIEEGKACNYAKLQGLANPGDLSWAPTLRLGYKQAQISNSGMDPVGFGISTRIDDPNPRLMGVIYPGKIAYMGVNPPGEPTQYLHILSPDTGKRVGPSTPIATDSNHFALRQGIEFWWNQPYWMARGRGAPA